MKHPQVSELADLARGLLHKQTADPLREHTLRCASCRRTLQALQSVAALGSVESGFTPPEAVLRLARAAFQPSRQAPVPSAWKRLASLLVFDSWQAPALAGVRSGGATERHVTYRAGDWEVDLRLERQRGLGLLVTGQVAHAKDSDVRLDGSPVEVRVGRRTLASTTLNAFGEFEVSCVRGPGDLRLDISMAARRTALQLPVPPFDAAPVARSTRKTVKRS